MGGKIWVESREGEGTQFHFTMILNAAEDKPPGSPVPNLVGNVPPDDRHCLIIEHSPIVRALLSRDISTVGLQGNAVANFSEAQYCLRLQRYSVVIIDGSLPRSEAFVHELAESDPYARAIVTSNLGTVAILDGPNVIATLVRPIRRWRLVKALETALNRSPTITMDEIDFFTPKDDQRQALATLAFRHPLRILVCPLNGFTNDSLPRTIQSILRSRCNISNEWDILLTMRKMVWKCWNYANGPHWQILCMT